MQSSQNPPRALLTALDVQQLLHIDRSTVYRMAEDGRLPAIRVGRSWRFPAERIEALLGHDEAASATAADAAPQPPAPRTGHPTPVADVTDGPPLGVAEFGTGSAAPADSADGAPISSAAAAAAVEVAADLLGVMMLVTDMHGRPMTSVAHPCPWFLAHAEDPEMLDRCVAEWHDLADHPDLTPRFQLGALGFECARAFIRRGSTLIGMVLAGGVSPSRSTSDDPDLYHLDQVQRERVLAALPRIAATISTSPRSGSTPTPAPQIAVAPRPAPEGATTKEN
jgi:excisionase family DNA binding protein